MIVSEIIIKWYRINARELPWRKVSDPYKIWVSEIILQQTRVNQGINYYYRFIEEFPSVADLANSSIDRLMKVWQGLGYYSRARNMHHTAKYIILQYQGIFPDNIDELMKLKGIGEYTAAAIASIAFNKPNAVVDGNVFRVLSRYYSIDIPINSGKGGKYFYEIANKILDQKDPGIHNQALMELGAVVCIASIPKCEVCPLNESCIALNSNTINKYPVKLKKSNIKERYFNYIIIKKEGRVLIRQRPVGDIWALLYEFPLIETSNRHDLANIFKLQQWLDLFPNDRYKIIFISEEYKHKLTHRLIYVRFIEVEVEENFKLSGFLEVDRQELDKYAFPAIIDKYCIF